MIKSNRIKYVDNNVTGGNVSNIYDTFIKTASNSDHFILRYYQTMPKYYFLDGGNRTLICNYGLGTGKSATAIFIATYYLKQLNKMKFLNHTAIEYNKIVVLGSWVTINAFQNDILRPEFHFTTNEQMNNIKEKMNSPFKEIREEGENELKELKKSINKNFIFKNFQSIFNMVFPTLDEQKYVQHVDSLIQGWKNGELVISQDFLNSLRNSLIIIDECQHLWNQQGMNTYGFVIGLLIKKAEEYNIRFVFLSGTIINNNICELASIYSVLKPDNFINENDYCTEKVIMDTNIRTLNMSKFNEISDFLYDKFLYYSNNSNTNSSTLNKVKLLLSESSELVENEKILKYQLDKNDETITSEINLDRLVIKSDNPLVPTVWHLGNRVIKNENQDMVIYSVPLQGIQLQKYDEYLNGEIDLNENEDENRSSLHDGYLTSTDDIYYSGGVYTGKGLLYPNLKNYSAIGAEMVRLCIYNTLRGEKVVCYHDKIAKLGLKQYIEYLKINGYVEYGTPINTNTRCTRCGITLSEHQSNHAFVPMSYAVLSGDIPENTRKKITEIWNNPNNITGNVISVLMISSVAYAGVSFFNTTNMIILNKISNMSKWKQICGRIVRIASHSLLPKNKRIAKIYTMTVHSPNEKGIDLETKYYMIKNILNNEIIDAIDKLYKNSITDDLFNGKIKIKNDKTYNIFMNDVNEELGVVVHRMDLSHEYPWTKEGFIQRIKSTLNALSYIDYSKFDDEYIQNLITENNFVKIFKYKNLSKYFYIPTLVTQKKNSNIVCPTFKFSDLCVIKIEGKNIKSGVEKLIDIVKTNDVISIKNHLYKLMKLLNNNPREIMKYPIFWKAIYAIHDEYYADDNKNFVKNHSTEGRDFEKIAGVYVGNKIYLKDSEDVIKLTVKKGDLVEWPEIPYRFKITTYANNKADDSLWSLRVIIIENTMIYSDKRKINTGLNCISFDISKLVKYLPKINLDLTKKEICIDLISIICDYALEKKHKLSTIFD